MKKHHQTVIVLIRIFLGFIFFGAGMSKLYFEHKFPELLARFGLKMN